MRIADHLSAHVDKIHVALFNHQISNPGFFDTADNTDGHFRIFYDLVRTWYIQRTRFAGRRQKGSCVIERSVGEVDIIYARLFQLAHDKDILKCSSSARLKVVRAKAYRNREILSHCLTYCRADLYQETASAHDGSTILICPVVNL